MSGRGTLIAALDRILSLTGGLLPDATRRNLVQARARVAEDRLNLVVLGEFKRGKSTLINALLDRDLLPTGVLPLTSVVTSIGAGARDRLVIRHDDGREVERPVDALADYVSLRSELAQRVLDAASTYRRELAAAVSDAVQAIRHAVERVAGDRRRGEGHAAARRQELAHIERECELLAREMDCRLRDRQLRDESGLR